ncbi:MAG: GNAT family N-acetyltransferase, partial [Propionibacterium sp.]|nr:GNAT family N-acetyltransferase [Propionibacterium sp.]
GWPPEHRGEGLGTALVSLLADRARTRGGRYAYLQVLADNVAARRLYERLGWQVHHGYTYLTLGGPPHG